MVSMCTAINAGQGHRLPKIRLRKENQTFKEAKLTLNPRKLCQVINDDLASVDVVINEWHALFRIIAPKDRHASKTEARGADNAMGAIRTVLCFFLSSTRIVKTQSHITFHKTYLLHRDELSIDRDQRSRFRKFFVGETLVLNKVLVPVPTCQRLKE